MVNNGLYNMLFGEDKNAGRFLEMLDLERDMFQRYRDCYLNGDGTRIIVLTRIGGSNRPSYDEVFDNIHTHPCFLSDYDDPKDETYCYFEFKVPEKYLRETQQMANGIEPLTVGEKFDKEIAEMNEPGSEAAKRAEKIANHINKQVLAQPNGGVIWMGDLK